MNHAYNIESLFLGADFRAMAEYAKTEKETILAAKGGDLEAFEKILSKYERPIFNYVLRLTNHRQNAEDLTQEAFLKFYKNIKSVDPDKNVKSWLYKIATNTVYDWFRKQKNARELFIIDDPENNFETVAEGSVEEDMENIDNAAYVDKALLRIKPIYRTVLLLYYYQDFSYEEISRILSVPLNTVKTYLSRAKQSLRLTIAK